MSLKISVHRLLPYYVTLPIQSTKDKHNCIASRHLIFESLITVERKVTYKNAATITDGIALTAIEIAQLIEAI